MEYLGGVDLSTPPVESSWSSCVNHVEYPMHQTEVQSSLATAEMSNLVNLEEFSVLTEREMNDLSSELPGNIDLGSILNDLSVQTNEMFATKYNDSIYELHLSSKATATAESKGASSEAGSCLNFDNSSPFSSTELVAETFGNITDFFKQNSTSCSVDVDSMNEMFCNLEDHVNAITSGEDTNSECKTKNVPGKTSKLKSPHEKYLEMRRKNNVASRRSRQIRKEKIKEMDSEIMELEAENVVLKRKAEELEKQKDVLQQYLFKIMKQTH